MSRGDFPEESLHLGEPEMSGHPSPQSARPRLRLHIRTLMILVAVLGLVAWGYRRWDQYRRVRDDYQRAAARLRWSEMMYHRGYVSKAQFESETAAYQRAEAFQQAWSWLGL